jgi:broad specificity phosphatase PhoE
LSQRDPSAPGRDCDEYVQRIYANTGDSFPLTERGFEQVKALASRLSAFNISAVCAIPLLRAVQTTEEICRLKKIQVKIAPELAGETTRNGK